MEPKKSNFQRNLLVVLVTLYLLTLAALIYPQWVAESPGWQIAANLLILSIPLVLLYGSLYVLVMGRQERATLGEISPRLAKIIHWAPRVAAILIILFTGLFSLDVFEMGGTPLQLLGAFLMHSLPSLVMLVVLILAWKRPVVGFAAFLIVGIVFAILFLRDIFALSNLVLFVLPLLLIASLFYADWQWVRQ